MNSISICSESVMDQIKENKSFEFVKLYSNAAEIEGTQLDRTAKKVKKMNKKSQAELKHSQSPNKTKKKKSNETDLSRSLVTFNFNEHNEVDEHNYSSETTRSSRKGSLKATPSGNSEHLDDGVKSMMKNKSNNIDSLSNVSNVSNSSNKPKKRNKSVSFVLEDAEEMVVKKSKSNNSDKKHKNKVMDQKKNEKEANTKIRKQRKRRQLKENQNSNEDTEFGNKENITSETNKIRDSTSDTLKSEEVTGEVKKKVKKDKKPQPENEKGTDITEDIVTEESSSQNKSKKSKKKKRKVKSMQDENTDNTEGEPASKTRKKDLKPEVIAKGLENLNIGDNTHTLTNLLDEMTVVDKNAKKKERQKQKKNKLKKPMTAKGNPDGASQHGVNVEEKEKVKWTNRKWNKDAKGDMKSRLNTSVVVENLPIKIMCNYKKLLSEHFSKFGTIAGIGVAEAYPTEDLKPVFTTTVFFQEEEAVAKVLEEDNTVLEGSRVRVRRARPPTDTTLVVRAYGLSEQALSSLFSGAGRVRAIRQLVKGKKSMPTAFVEFDGPEAVERALKIAEDAKIKRNKMYVSKYEIRDKRKPHPPEKSSINGDDSDSSTE